MRTYVVWCPDLGQEQEAAATIPATDPADAAEGWAEWHDRSSAEYRIASGREEIVIVRDVETGEQGEWIVRGEAMPYYTARMWESPTIRAQVAPLALIDAAPECTCAAKDMTFGRCCKVTPNKCRWCGHDALAHDKQYGCAEDGCDCETPNAGIERR